jgi:hypothetical protein
MITASTTEMVRRKKSAAVGNKIGHGVSKRCVAMRCQVALFQRDSVTPRIAQEILQAKLLEPSGMFLDS